jgi:uncharacterized protein YndB with AHSA1/START domain
LSRIVVSAERVIDAPAEDIYRYIADYRQHHPHFLPPEFSNVRVEAGGFGEGTIISFDLTLAKRRQHFRGRIEEPTPQRVIIERSLDLPQVTTFRIDPEETGTRVRIELEREARGFQGLVERFVAPRLLRPLFQQELELLERYARSQ